MRVFRPTTSFRITSVVATGNDLTINWQSEPNRDYKIETTTNPSDENWIQLGTSQRGGNYTHAGGAKGIANIFYRVRWVD